MKDIVNFLPGESVIDFAPKVTLPNGRECVPQHFLRYQHTRATVEAILNDVECHDRYLIFVGENTSAHQLAEPQANQEHSRENHQEASQESGQVYLQVGVIGPDNYQVTSEDKLVYGRKWRVETDLPSSEMIQTAFLAVQKAREHEIRERLTINANGRITTPFNHHHDLPLMAQNAGLLLATSNVSPQLCSNEPQQSLQAALTTLRYDHATAQLQRVECLSDNLWLVQVRFESAANSILEEVLDGLSLNMLVTELSWNHFLHTLMAELVAVSNRWVAEHFTYKGFARFSEKVQVTQISQLSSTTRGLNIDDASHQAHANLQYGVDANRRPVLPNTNYSQSLEHKLQKYEPLQGVKPIFCR